MFAFVAIIFAMFFLDLQPSEIAVINIDNQKRNVYQRPPGMNLNTSFNYKAVVQTSYGTFSINLFEKINPKNVNNFVFLAEEGYYDGLRFNRIISDFIIQVGGVETDSGVQYTIEDELKSFVKFDEYTVAMVNDDKPNTNRGEFFITLKNSEVSHLDGQYTIIGVVENGKGVVDRIGKVKSDSNFVPAFDIEIEKIFIKKES